MTSYTLPIPELKRLEPILEELFGYRRAMFENELLNVYRTKYPNGISKEVANNYMIACPFLNEIAVDNGAFDYHRYAPRPASTSMELDVKNFIMDTEHEITIVLSNDTILKQLDKLLQDYGEKDSSETIRTTLFIVAAIYDKHVKGELYTEITTSENTLPYLQQVRPEMLKLFELLNTKRYSPSKKKELRVLNSITIDNGVKKITLENSCHWLTDLLDDYLQIYLGVKSLEEAQAELKEVYAEKKGRKASNVACNLIMYGTFHLLQKYSSLKTKSEQIRMTLDYMGHLFEADSFNDDEASTNAAIAYLVKQGYKPQWKPKQIEDYNFSPNNQSTEYLW